MFGSYLVREGTMDSISEANTPISDADASASAAMTAVTASLPAAVRVVDVVDERARTAGAGQSRHLNAAGSALPSLRVVETVVEHLRLEEAMGGYEAAALARPRVEAVYDAAAELIGAHRDEIALIDSASSGLRVVLDALRLRAGARIIATRATYVSHALHLMTLAREEGVLLEIVPTGADQRTDLDALERLLQNGPTAVVTVAHVPTSSGIVEPVAEIGALVAKHGGFYVLDATQSVGHLAIDVRTVGCDVLVTTGRKFLRAPRGTGFAYVRAAAIARLLPTAPDVRAAHWTEASDWDVDGTARRFETWESSIAGRLGLGAALEEVLERGIDATEEWLTGAGRRLRATLAGIDGVRVAEPVDTASAIVTFVIDGIESGDVVARLAQQNVRVVSVPATHGQWDLGERGIRAVVRASIHVYNDENDIAALIEHVTDFAREAAERA